MDYSPFMLVASCLSWWYLATGPGGSSKVRIRSRTELGRCRCRCTQRTPGSHLVKPGPKDH
jgi:hypothetical protein